MSWTQKILRVNLTEGTCTAEPLNMQWANDYLGQRGLASKYLSAEVDPKCDPLSPENKMTVYSLNPSTDGKYIVMENADSFIVYDVNSDKILPSTVPRSLPKGFVGRGHTRTIGQ